ADDELPAASSAVAVMVCDPTPAAGASHAKPYGGAVAVACSDPSTENSTRSTPTSSDASAVTSTPAETEDPSAGAVMATAGRVLSAPPPPPLSTVTDATSVVP